MHQPMFSIEVFPPKRNAPVGTIYDTLDGLQGLNPDFISVTYGTGKSSDRTATARIANTIRKEYDIPAVAHLTAQYTTREQVDEALDMFKQAGVSAVLALRGDPVPGREPAGAFEHASDLVAYIREHDPDMTIFGACYPECHPQATDLDEDIRNLKIKVDAGASHLISQLFYDNADFYHFLDKARAVGIDVPIEAGIMPVTNASQIIRICQLSGTKLPPQFRAMVERFADKPAALKQAGIAYATGQIIDLISNGFNHVHIYTMNRPEIIGGIMANLSEIVKD